MGLRGRRAGSWRNGAPMRVSPVGWLASEETNARELAAAQAAVSHDHPDAVAASQGVALTILWLRQGVPSATVRQRVINDFGYDLTPERAFRRGGFDISAAGTVPPALTAAFAADNWESAVRTAVCLGRYGYAGLHHRGRRRSTARATGRHRCSEPAITLRTTCRRFCSASRQP